MYHQVKVLKEDTDSLRFLWREKFNASIDEHIMCAHIFGKVESPCCANWALKITARDNKPKFSLRAIETVLELFYMDDYLDSFPGLEEAIKVIVEVIQLLKMVDLILPSLFRIIQKLISIPVSNYQQQRT